jgi:myo-inositol-1(or 4)-monophosphatase
MTPTNDNLMKTLTAALRAAGDIQRRMARRPLTVTHKGRVDIVTQVDHAAERAIVRAVKKVFPGHAFLLEEGGAMAGDGVFRWIVDPVDGTVNYAHGLGISCVSIGVEKDGAIVMGGVYDAFRDEMFLAVRGKGARLNGRHLKVSGTSKLVDALVVTGFPYDRQKNAGFYTEKIRRALEKVQDVRRLGSAALDLCYVACGRVDAYWEYNVKPWDVAAGALMVAEAGGRLTRLDDRPFDHRDPSQTLATNGRLHGSMRRLLR